LPSPHPPLPLPSSSSSATSGLRTSRLRLPTRPGTRARSGHPVLPLAAPEAEVSRSAQKYKVTWDTSDAPAQISNGFYVVLRYEGLQLPSTCPCSSLPADAVADHGRSATQLFSRRTSIPVREASRSPPRSSRPGRTAATSRSCSSETRVTGRTTSPSCPREGSERPIQHRQWPVARRRFFTKWLELLYPLSHNYDASWTIAACTLFP
jgi:hypothetical protein